MRAFAQTFASTQLRSAANVSMRNICGYFKLFSITFAAVLKSVKFLVIENPSHLTYDAFSAKMAAQSHFAYGTHLQSILLAGLSRSTFLDLSSAALMHVTKLAQDCIELLSL